MEESQRGQLVTEELFREAYGFEEGRKKKLRSVIVEALKCSKEKALKAFPFAVWIREYDFKSYFLGDMVAGVTVAVMHIPHGLAYSGLGRVDPVVGFYMAVFPVLIYFFLGTSRHLSIGTFAVVCSMVGEVVYRNIIATGAVDEDIQDVISDEAKRVDSLEIATAICMMVGLWQAGLGLLHLGSLSAIMSDSFVAGYTAAAAIHVFTYQLRNLFGVTMGSHAGIFKLFTIYVDFFSNIKTVNLVTMSISIICISILIFVKQYVKGLVQKKFPNNKFPIPIELIVIIAGILFSYTLNLSQNYNVSIVETIPSGFPEVRVPSFKLFPCLIEDSLVIAVVTTAVSISMTKMFAKKGFYKVSINHELFAYGAANIFGSFFQCLPSAASLSRTNIQYRTGGNTQVASLFSLTVIFVILLFAGPLFEPVPYCVLSSIVVVSLQNLLLQVKDLPKVWKQKIWNGIVWLGTYISVIVLGLDLGLLIGLILSGLAIGFEAHSYKVIVLGKVPETNIYLPIDLYVASQDIPNILILQISGKMTFVNSSHIAESIIKELNKASQERTDKIECLVITMYSMPEVDPAGVKEIVDLYTYLQNINCDLYFTDCSFSVYKFFEVCNLFKAFPKDHVAATLSDAVEYLSAPTRINEN